MGAFQSKSFISTLVLLIMTIAVSLVPELEPVSEMMVDDIATIIVALIAGHKVKDVLIDWVNKRYPTGGTQSAFQDTARMAELSRKS